MFVLGKYPTKIKITEYGYEKKISAFDLFKKLS